MRNYGRIPVRCALLCWMPQLFKVKYPFLIIFILSVPTLLFAQAPNYGNNDRAGKYVVANGIKIYYEEYGQGQPLLLLHGNSESGQAFRLQTPEFSKYYRVIAVDTRGQGK